MIHYTEPLYSLELREINKTRRSSFSSLSNLYPDLHRRNEARHTTVGVCVHESELFPLPLLRSHFFSVNEGLRMNETYFFQFKSTAESNWTWRMLIARHKIKRQKILEYREKRSEKWWSVDVLTRRGKSILAWKVTRKIWFCVLIPKVMAPTMGLNNSNGNGQNGDSPLSKTYQYRKIMKPMLERKRRARINRCLDELKELITGALQNVSCEWRAIVENADAISCHRTELP